LKEEIVLRKGKMYLLLKKEREEMYEFIEEQLRKRYQTLKVISNSTYVFCRKKG